VKAFAQFRRVYQGVTNRIANANCIRESTGMYDNQTDIGLPFNIR